MNIITSGFRGNIYPIHLTLYKAPGHNAYKSMVELPETPDLVMIALHAKIVPQIFEECGKKGVKNVILVSGGFREIEGYR